MLSGEATNTNFIVVGLTRPGLEPTIYHTQDEHTNYYTTDAVKIYIVSPVFEVRLSNLLARKLQN
jgi:hypothetical protein